MPLRLQFGPEDRSLRRYAPANVAQSAKAAAIAATAPHCPSKTNACRRVQASWRTLSKDTKLSVPRRPTFSTASAPRGAPRAITLAAAIHRSNTYGLKLSVSHQRLLDKASLSLRPSFCPNSADGIHVLPRCDVASRFHVVFLWCLGAPTASGSVSVVSTSAGESRSAVTAGL